MTDWRDEAACRDSELDWICDPGTKQLVAELKRICSECRVANDCLDFAMETNQAYGVWGGMTSSERLRMRRQSRRLLVSEQ